MKTYQKLLLFAVFVLILIIWIVATTEKKETASEPPAKVERKEPAEPQLPKDPKGEKILMMSLPAQDTTVVFKLDSGDVVKISEIRNESNAVLIWTSESRNYYQIILRDKYPDWSPNVEGGVFKLKNGRKLTVKFEN